jgi:hypothetical protein
MYVIDGYIQNDLDLDELYETIETNTEFLDRVLVKEEEYVPIERYPDYVITSLGRIINTRNGKTTKPTFSPVNVHMMWASQRDTLANMFANTPFDYDIQQIRQNYDDNGWPYKDS